MKKVAIAYGEAQIEAINRLKLRFAPPEPRSASPIEKPIGD